jgi:hypothetical protein
MKAQGFFRSWFKGVMITAKKRTNQVELELELELELE